MSYIFNFMQMLGDVPVFSNLTHVHLVYCSYIHWNFVFNALMNCPRLQNFDLEMPQTQTLLYYVRDVMPLPSILSECISLQLQNCSIKNFRRDEYGMKFVRYIMLNSTSLQTITICASSSMDPRMKLELQEELFSFPKSSANCQIYFQ
jgi:hypothetical protein